MEDLSEEEQRLAFSQIFRKVQINFRLTFLVAVGFASYHNILAAASLEEGKRG